LQPPAHPAPDSDPNPSWQVILAPEFITTWAAASAPVNWEVFTVIWAFVATTSAWIVAPELMLIPFDACR
jgi:hypothetical protein